MAGGDDLKLLGLWSSPFVLRVQLALSLKGLGYEYIEEEALVNKGLSYEYIFFSMNQEGRGVSPY
jgi:glutathione S-transferase